MPNNLSWKPYLFRICLFLFAGILRMQNESSNFLCETPLRLEAAVHFSSAGCLRPLVIDSPGFLQEPSGPAQSSFFSLLSHSLSPVSLSFTVCNAISANIYPAPVYSYLRHLAQGLLYLFPIRFSLDLKALTLHTSSSQGLLVA